MTPSSTEHREERSRVPKPIRPAIVASRPPPATPPERVAFVGSHLILDLWEARALDDERTIERALRDSAAAAEATLLHLHLHRFEPNGGVSGVAVLAESHISIHTWPERGYAALDLFMCGRCDPQKAVPVLRQAFAPRFIVVSEHRRGGGGASL
jgi:S-adenosylmethionine decarboxylase